MTKPDWWTAGLPGSAIRRDDVPLHGAMLLWDDGYRAVLDCDCAGDYHHCRALGSEPVKRPPVVMDHDLLSDDPSAWDNASGACFADWAARTDDGRLAELLRDAWMAVLRDGVDMAAMHGALLAVPEFRAMMHPGELPTSYRDE